MRVLTTGTVFNNISCLSHITKRQRPCKKRTRSQNSSICIWQRWRKNDSRCVFQDFWYKHQSRACFDLKDLFTFLSTQSLSIDRYKREDVGSIRFEFQTGSVHNISWIPGKINLPDFLTTKTSPLNDVFQLVMSTGKAPINYVSEYKYNSTEKNVGLL